LTTVPDEKKAEFGEAQRVSDSGSAGSGKLQDSKIKIKTFENRVNPVS
jgi:hypothetical protein